MGRGVAAAIVFAAAAGSGLVAALVAASPSWGLWAALAVLVAGGAGAQGILTASEKRSRKALASGAGSVAVAGSARGVRTHVVGTGASGEADSPADVAATGPGAVSVGGDADRVSTEVSDREQPAGQ